MLYLLEKIILLRLGILPKQDSFSYHFTSLVSKFLFLLCIRFCQYIYVAYVGSGTEFLMREFMSY